MVPHDDGHGNVQAAPCDPPRIIAPMLLAIDIGNTNTTIGLLRNGALVATRRAASNPRATADEVEFTLDGLLHLDDASFGDVDAIACASVVPALTAHIETIAARRERPLTIATAGIVPLAVRTERPGEVGADRLVNALAAGRLYGTPAVVVDFGTATTFDVVSRRGEYVGGAIAPGIGTSLDALAERGAQLRTVELLRPRTVIAKNTVEALQSGVLYGFAGQVDGIVARMAAELGVPLDDIPVVATGGLASVVVPESRTIDHHEPDLTLLGLRLVYDRNTG